MKINVIATGSNGNLYELIDSKDNSMLIEAGVPRYTYTKFRESSKIPEILIISHKHGDHSFYANEFMMICEVKKWVQNFETDNFKGFGYKVTHGDVLNYAYFIQAKKDNEMLFFATDLEWNLKTINPIIEAFKMLKNQGKDVSRMLIELNYNNYLYHKATPEQRFGCDRHFSDNDVINFAKATGVTHPKIVTIHGSNRLSTDSWTKRYLKQRLPNATVRVAVGVQNGVKNLFYI